MHVVWHDRPSDKFIARRMIGDEVVLNDPSAFGDSQVAFSVAFVFIARDSIVEVPLSFGGKNVIG